MISNDSTDTAINEMTIQQLSVGTGQRLGIEAKPSWERAPRLYDFNLTGWFPKITAEFYEVPSGLPLDHLDSCGDGQELRLIPSSNQRGITGFTFTQCAQDNVSGNCDTSCNDGDPGLNGVLFSYDSSVHGYYANIINEMLEEYCDYDSSATGYWVKPRAFPVFKVVPDIIAGPCTIHIHGWFGEQRRIGDAVSVSFAPAADGQGQINIVSSDPQATPQSTGVGRIVLADLQNTTVMQTLEVQVAPSADAFGIFDVTVNDLLLPRVVNVVKMEKILPMVDSNHEFAVQPLDYSRVIPNVHPIDAELLNKLYQAHTFDNQKELDALTKQLEPQLLKLRFAILGNNPYASVSLKTDYDQTEPSLLSEAQPSTFITQKPIIAFFGSLYADAKDYFKQNGYDVIAADAGKTESLSKTFKVFLLETGQLRPMSDTPSVDMVLFRVIPVSMDDEEYSALTQLPIGFAKPLAIAVMPGAGSNPVPSGSGFGSLANPFEVTLQLPNTFNSNTPDTVVATIRSNFSPDVIGPITLTETTSTSLNFCNADRTVSVSFAIAPKLTSQVDSVEATIYAQQFAFATRKMTLNETGVTTNVFESARATLKLTFATPLDSNAIGSVTAEVKLGNNPAAQEALTETQAGSKIFSNTNSSFTVSLNRITGFNALICDDLTATVTNTALSLNGVSIDAIETGLNTLIFDTTAITATPASTSGSSTVTGMSDFGEQTFTQTPMPPRERVRSVCIRLKILGLPKEQEQAGFGFNVYSDTGRLTSQVKFSKKDNALISEPIIFVEEHPEYPDPALSSFLTNKSSLGDDEPLAFVVGSGRIIVSETAGQLQAIEATPYWRTKQAFDLYFFGNHAGKRQDLFKNMMIAHDGNYLLESHNNTKLESGLTTLGKKGTSYLPVSDLEVTFGIEDKQKQFAEQHKCNGQQIGNAADIGKWGAWDPKDESKVFPLTLANLAHQSTQWQGNVRPRAAILSHFDLGGIDEYAKDKKVNNYMKGSDWLEPNGNAKFSYQDLFFGTCFSDKFITDLQNADQRKQFRGRMLI
ncbi:MAG: hypothetical protein V1899_07640, partial [Planctomycetota bacterium]